MDYVIAIPSHERSDVINNKTLKMLRHYNIDLERVYIFVEESQIPIYRNRITSKNVNIIKGELGIQENRKIISEYFNEGQYIVSLDDDIKWICNMVNKRGGKHQLEKIECFEKLILDVHDKMIEEGAGFAGLYPIDNPFFMKRTITTDLRFIIGQVKFFINTHQLEQRRFTLLEDFETTLKYYLYYGKVIRYNNICPVANYKPIKWGLTQENKNDEVRRFHHKYFEYTKINHKVNGNTDIRFIPNPKKTTLSTLWINEKINELTQVSIGSWIKQGYDVDLYTNLNYEDLPKEWINNVKIKNPYTICKYDNEDILAYSDYWRYNLLLKVHDAIWIDSDMYLCDRLPMWPTLITSEHTFQTGAFKSNLTWVANIGILKFRTYLGREFLEEIIDKIDNKIEQSKFCDNMKIFRNVLKKKKYKELYDMVSPPNLFCPIPWWNCDEIYLDHRYTKKYGVRPRDNNYIFKYCNGVHLWQNFTYNKHRIDFNDIKVNSLYYRIKNLR